MTLGLEDPLGIAAIGLGVQTLKLPLHSGTVWQQEHGRKKRLASGVVALAAKPVQFRQLDHSSQRRQLGSIPRFF